MTSGPSELTRTGTILVVDDDPTTQNLLRILLEKQELDVMVASNGQQALAQLQEEVPDVVLLDILMPEMSGFEVLRTIRETPEHHDLPVIILTALGDQENMLRGLEMGANDYQSKPIQNQELMARVQTQVRMKQLQDQHRDAVERLEELDDLKDKFILIASHDLRGGLNTIRAGLQLLEDPPAVLGQEYLARTDKILSSMRSSVDEMESLVESLLDLQAIKAGVLELQMRRVSLNKLIEEAIERYQSYADMKSVTIKRDLDASLPEAIGDPARLSQVMSNLLSNAIKYSREGRGIVLRTKPVDDWLRVEVQDSGVGVPAEEMPMLFEEFTVGINRPTAGESSRGVGLSITRQLVELHGGRVGAESTPGSGSLFWFQLPRA